MSLPSFPVVNPPIEREDAVNQLHSSIAMEELGLSLSLIHISPVPEEAAFLLDTAFPVALVVDVVLQTWVHLKMAGLLDHIPPVFLRGADVRHHRELMEILRQGQDLLRRLGPGCVEDLSLIHI